jgi:hypothetical protein
MTTARPGVDGKCRDALSATAEFNKLVAAEFVHLHEDDQQYIVAHLLRKKQNQ